VTADVHFAARAAIRTYRANFLVNDFAEKRRFVDECAARTGIDACAATYAGAFGEWHAKRGRDLGSITAVPGFPNESPGNLIANPHAAVTVDAPRHVDVNTRVRIVNRPSANFRSQLSFEAIFSDEPMKSTGWRTVARGTRMSTREQPKLCPSQFLKEIGVRVDHHSFRDVRRACCDGALTTLDLDKAHPTAANRRQTRIVAERRNMQARLTKMRE
jgi:hypothetical protein